ncbi:DUF1176 domain-containing protein [Psychrobacter immobilis]|uniref:DUF1176 domain-containing protein n=1 Tax=Psychrobacter immobilis TaxID=498 RepID=UPI001D12F216|nr:DUF1176 domain-containing protein [Psychrobacter immobilis]
MKTIIALITTGLFALPTLASDSYGTPSEGWGFVKDDWQLVCDNTLTCRAAGYAAEGLVSSDKLGDASVLITVEAGKKLSTVQVKLSNWEEFEQEKLVPEQLSKTNYKVELLLNNKSYGFIQLSSEREGQLSTAQAQQLLKLANQNTKIQFTSGIYQWQVSDKGLAAVLLKLDEVQGRVGTPLALVSKSSLNRQTPKSAKAKPVIKKAYSYADKDKKQLTPAKLVYFQKNINKWIDIDDKQLVGSNDGMGDCKLVNPKTEAYQRMQEFGADRLGWDFIPVDSKHTLATHECWRGAYNMGVGHWLINHAKPSKPTLITTSASDYSDGEIYALHKDRGIGDCWNRAVWVWDGKTFALTEDSSTGMCRGFAGGAWDLPTYTSEVIRSDNKVN